MPTPLPTFVDFERQALAEGYDQVLVRDWGADVEVPVHTHPFAVKAVLAAGEMWLTCRGQTRHLQPGDAFSLSHAEPHAERYGPQGASFWVARRQQA